MNETAPRPRPLAGPLWNSVLTQLAPRLDAAWGELVRTALEWSAVGPGAIESGDAGPCWEGPLEPFDESLWVGLSPRLCQGVLDRMLGGTEADHETADRRGTGPSWGRLELQLLERLAGRAAVEFCAVLHAVAGLPLTVPCLWPVSVDGPSLPRSATAGFPGGGLGPGGLGPTSAAGDRIESGCPARSPTAMVSPAAQWRVQVTGTGLSGVLTFGLPEGVLALLEQAREGGATTDAAAATVTAEVVLAEVELPASEVGNLEVGDVIPLGREPGPEGELVYLDVPGVGRWPGRVVSRDGVLEFRLLPPPEAPN